MRYFTLEEANRALILIKPIVFDILEKRGKLLRIETQLRSMRANRTTNRTHQNRVEPAQLHKYDFEFRKLIDGIEYNVQEIAQVGCILKDIKRGLVDFQSWHDGREVSLCWQTGEDTVHFWHEASVGYTQRKTIDESFKPVMHTVSMSQWE